LKTCPALSEVSGNIAINFSARTNFHFVCGHPLKAFTVLYGLSAICKQSKDVCYGLRGTYKPGWSSQRALAVIGTSLLP